MFLNDCIRKRPDNLLKDYLIKFNNIEYKKQETHILGR